MLFVLTCSQEGTFDLIQPHLQGLPVFRFNIDKPEDYTWDFSKRGFEMVNVKSGESIDSTTLSSFYLRKPMYLDAIDVPAEGCLEDWRRKETDALFEDFFRECEHRGLTTLIHSRNANYGKMRQLHAAGRYFKVANWHMFQGALPEELRQGRWVAKSLTGTQIGRGKAFYVKEVDPTKLDVSYPWFLQEKIDGKDEVTVVYANGKIFAYRYPRTGISDSLDVRKATIDDPSKWVPCELSTTEERAIRAFMSDTGYSFGRFDFIRKDGELWFLELNPNGQWAWLDENNANGLISSIAGMILADDRRHTQKPEPN